MIDNFQQEIEKVNRIDKLIKSDISSRRDLCKNDKPTAMVFTTKKFFLKNKLKNLKFFTKLQSNKLGRC